MLDDRDAEKLYRRKVKEEKRVQDEIDKALTELLSSAHGRQYLWWLLQIGKVGLQPFATNALQTSFACGELNVGNQILSHIITVNPSGYVRMMQEQADARRANDTDDTDSDDAN